MLHTCDHSASPAALSVGGLFLIGQHPKLGQDLTNHEKSRLRALPDRA